MTRLQWKSSPFWLNQNVAIAYLSILFRKGESYLAGLLAERPTASWYARQTQRSASSGPRKSFMTGLQMLCGPMKPRYNSKHTGGSAAERRVRIVINYAQSTHQTPCLGWSQLLGYNKALYLWWDHECGVVYANPERVPCSISKPDPSWWVSLYAGQWPKAHISSSKACFSEQNINGGDPPESPDANPTENLWHELKVNSCTCRKMNMCHAFCSHLQEYIRREVKPKTKQELQAFSSFGAPLT